jgi:hypothetical protein
VRTETSNEEKMMMMSEAIGARYRLRHPEVEAVRLSAETFGRLVRAMPAEWFYGALNGDGAEPMQLLMRVSPGASNYVKAVEGDWVARNTHGEWSAYPPEEFARRFQLASDLEDVGVEDEGARHLGGSGEKIFFFTLALDADADAGALGRHALGEGFAQFSRSPTEKGPAGTYVVNTVDRTVRINWRAACRHQAVAEAAAYVEARTGSPVALGSDPEWDDIEPQEP